MMSSPEREDSPEKDVEEVTPAGDSREERSGDGKDRRSSKMFLEQDRFLPICNVGRIMRSCIPSNGKISKDARELVQESISEFISFITSEAGDICNKDKRKTISAEDMLQAMNNLGLEIGIDALKAFLRKHREATRPNYSETNPLPVEGGTGETSTAEDLTPMTFLGEVPPGLVRGVQIFVDPTSDQHYMVIQGDDGQSSLIPVEITAARGDEQEQAEGREREEQNASPEEMAEAVEGGERRLGDLGVSPLRPPPQARKRKSDE